MQATYDNTTIGLDLAKNVFYCTEMNQNRRVLRQTRLKRSQVLGYFSGLEASKVRCVAMEACGGTHFWGRKFEEFGLPVRLLPPRWVKAWCVTINVHAFQPSLDRERVLALAGLEFIERGESVLFVGPPGVGKSHLACALGLAAVKAGKSVYRCTLAELIDALALAHRSGTMVAKIRQFARYSLLIIDEISFLPLPREGANLFFQLVSARYEKGAMILTSNRTFSEWGEVFGNPVIASALLDRLLHHAIVISIEGASYRLREHRDLLQQDESNAPATSVRKKRGRPRKQKKEASIYNPD